MLWSKLKLLIARYKLNHIAVSLIVLFFLAVLFIEFILPDGYFYSDTSIAVWSTLFGAIVGGVFTLWGTQIESRRSARAAFYTRQKEEILSPLYDELKEIQDVVLKENPYPSMIVFQKGPQTMRPHPQYTVWGKIQIDTRYFDTPKNVRTFMDELYRLIHQYLAYRSTASSAVSNAINEVFLSELGIKNLLQNAGSVLLPLIAADKKEDFIPTAKNLFLSELSSENAQIAESEKLHLCSALYEKCWQLPEIAQIRSFYDLWVQQQAQTIELLGNLIEAVSYEYRR